MATIYKVCIPHTNRDYFDYQADTGLIPCIGARVWVPFRQKTRLGIVIAHDNTEHPGISLKSIQLVIDEQPLLHEAILTLCLWVANYYQSPLSEVIPLALPKKYRLGQGCRLPLADYYQLALSADKAHTLITSRAYKQHALIDFLNDQTASLSKGALVQEGFTASQIEALLAVNVLRLVQKITLPCSQDVPADMPLSLNPEQTTAVHTIVEHLHAYHCFLLQGVTGSGKTEVYLQVIANVLAENRQVLVLVPEIGLTPQLLARFSARFKEPMAVIHSHLNESERQVAWQLASDNVVKLVIGTRTAILLLCPP